MPEEHNFEHLQLVLQKRGPARLNGGGGADDETVAAKENRAAHSADLRDATLSASLQWSDHQHARLLDDCPELSNGVPLLLRVDTSLDLDHLKSQFDFEIVVDNEDGYVIVASEDVQLSVFQERLTDFVSNIRGSASVAYLHEIHDGGSDERLRQVLSDQLYADWSKLEDNQEYVLDIGIACTGSWDLPRAAKPQKRWKPETVKRKENEWKAAVQAAQDGWLELQDSRLEDIQCIVDHYGASLGQVVHDPVDVPDHFSVRVRITGRGLKDLVLSYAYVFEVVEPEDIETPQQVALKQAEVADTVEFQAPASDAPRVCVIDSGIQEQHRWLSAAVNEHASKCFLPNIDGVADGVSPGGHGTRVAGAVLYGDTVPSDGVVELATIIENARVLNDRCEMPREMFPPAVLNEVVRHFQGDGTRIFNHSINSDAPCRTVRMSAWAAEIDRLSHDLDVLIVQSVGNLKEDRAAPRPGVAQLHGSSPYPTYLDAAASRIANPAQSLQALTVGSVAYDAFNNDDYQSLARSVDAPSAFSRSGFGLWGVPKPDVVEHGGDFVTGSGTVMSPPERAASCCPELVRSTLSGGPAFDRDAVGTSFAAPKVARVAAAVAATLPDEPCLLYRALVAQSARWPSWAENLRSEEQLALLRRVGYGVPDLDRATINTESRVTLITDGVQSVKAGHCDIYHVPIPTSLRGQSNEADFRIEVTLSYSAAPRRTRRGHAYLETWADWRASHHGETFDVFAKHAMKDSVKPNRRGAGLPWRIHPNSQHGLDGAKRNIGTLQKDWAVVRSYSLPESFCIAVRGHRGWSNHPDSTAKYALAVTLESDGQSESVYDEVRSAVIEIRGQVEADAQVKVEV